MHVFFLFLSFISKKGEQQEKNKKKKKKKKKKRVAGYDDPVELVEVGHHHRTHTQNKK